MTKKQKKIAVYAGSFDPITLGHMDVIERAVKIFDELHVVIAVNPAKNYFFSKDDRVSFVKTALSAQENIIVSSYDGLITDFAREVGACVLIRGLRAMSDFDYEFHMATFNKQLSPELETIFITTRGKYFYVTSTAIRELAKYGKDVSAFVPEVVAARLKELK